jgi:hypothetical protein
MSTVLIQQQSNELDTFVNLSAILTGIDASLLRPFLDTHETAQEYLNVVKRNADTTWTQLQAIMATTQGKTNDEIGALVLQQSGVAVGNLAKSIMLLWYLAAWYDPTKLPDTSQFTVVSSDAYTQGWIWRVGQTHPMGYSTWRFGYWNQPPQPLSAFIGGGKSK